MTLINWPLAKQPINWVIIIMMLVIAGIAGQLVLQHFGISPQTGS